jgi:hypothetical protein
VLPDTAAVAYGRGRQSWHLLGTYWAVAVPPQITTPLPQAPCSDPMPCHSLCPEHHAYIMHCSFPPTHCL